MEAEYLCEQAWKYRDQAATAADPALREELLDLATVCEDVAASREDRIYGG